jgi:hypothetical protein
MWESVYTLKYRLLPPTTEPFLSQTTDADDVNNNSSSREPTLCGLNEESSGLVKFLIEGHPFSVSTSDTTYEILALLRVLHAFSVDWPTLYMKVLFFVCI